MEEESINHNLQNCLHAWFCIVNKDSFQIIKDNRLYGVPKRAFNRIKNIQTGDCLFFYAVYPHMSILGVSKAVSSYFESKELFPWNERLYPFRIRLDKVFELNIPLKAFKGRISGINSSSNPIPMGVSIVPLSIDDAKLIISLNNE